MSEVRFGKICSYYNKEKSECVKDLNLKLQFPVTPSAAAAERTFKHHRRRSHSAEWGDLNVEV